MIDVATILKATGAELWQSDKGRLAPATLSAHEFRNSFDSVTVDSRDLSASALFVALKGERVDGHDFVQSALDTGATGCLVSRLPPVTPSPDAAPTYMFLVPDTLRALHELAGYWRRSLDVTVVGVTGSVGKTTTKDVVASTLDARYSVLKSKANLNTEIGLPLTLLQLRPEHQIGVLEMGMYVPGDIALLADIAQPDIGIVTNVAPIHLERAGSIERIARTKSELVAALPREGLAVLNGDDPWTRAMAIASGIAPATLFGFEEACDVRASHVNSRGLEGTNFTVEAETQRLEIETHIPGVHTVYAVLAAMCVARRFGLQWSEIQDIIGAVRLDSRQRIVQVQERTLIIDDTYNAAPISVNAALQLLSAAPGAKIAVLGDMLELGPGEEQAHREVGVRAAQVADWLVVRGERSNWIADAAILEGLPSNRVVRPRTNHDAVTVVRTIISSTSPGSERTMQSTRRPGGEVEPVEWSVLVKGSRGMRLEEVVHGLRGEL